jgi:type II secretory pathway pseudopilin PulG
MIRRRRDSGVSMIELIIALAVMVLALVALMSSVISSSKVSDSSKESVIAYEAARAKIEEIRTFTKCGTFNNIFNYYKPGATAAGVPTYWTTVSGLNPIQINGVNQPTLQVLFPVDIPVSPAWPATPTNMSSIHLTEAVPSAGTYPTLNADAIRMGMPKDLNRNGSDGGGTPWDTGGTTPDLDTTYGVIPIMIRVQWESIGKRPTQIEVVTYITEK